MSKDKIFEKIYAEFRKKDYFYTEVVIKNEIERRDNAKEHGQDVSKFTDEYIREVIDQREKDKVYKQVYEPLVNAIESGDIEELKKRLRYDQKFSLAAFSELTEKDITKFSNKKIKDYLENEFETVKLAYRTKSDELTTARKMPFVKEVDTNKDVVLPKGTKIDEIIKTEEGKHELVLVYFRANDKEYYTSKGRFEDALKKHLPSSAYSKLASELMKIAKLLT